VALEVGHSGLNIFIELAQHAIIPQVPVQSWEVNLVYVGTAGSFCGTKTTEA
jgi:hypothetical protein